jgi:dihydroxyacid dehydratase/phosphogluconate dehydratase
VADCAQGNLAPDGAIFKRAAATRSLFEHEGRRWCSRTGRPGARIDDPKLDVEADDILVLKNAGPKAAAMPEAGYLPIPRKLARQGVKDMVRISDARMSGTAFGTVVLHVAPEAAVGGPLAACAMATASGCRCEQAHRLAWWTKAKSPKDWPARTSRSSRPARTAMPRCNQSTVHPSALMAADFDFSRRAVTPMAHAPHALWDLSPARRM